MDKNKVSKLRAKILLVLLVIGLLVTITVFVFAFFLNGLFFGKLMYLLFVLPTILFFIAPLLLVSTDSKKTALTLKVLLVVPFLLIPFIPMPLSELLGPLFLPGLVFLLLVLAYLIITFNKNVDSNFLKTAIVLLVTLVYGVASVNILLYGLMNALPNY
jgi:hypothetical protein